MVRRSSLVKFRPFTSFVTATSMVASRNGFGTGVGVGVAVAVGVGVGVAVVVEVVVGDWFVESVGVLVDGDRWLVPVEPTHPESTTRTRRRRTARALMHPPFNQK